MKVVRRVVEGKAGDLGDVKEGAWRVLGCGPGLTGGGGVGIP